MKFLGGIILLVAGGLAQPVVMSWVGASHMDTNLATSMAGNVATLAAIGFLLIGFDRGKPTP